MSSRRRFRRNVPLPTVAPAAVVASEAAKRSNPEVWMLRRKDASQLRDI
jgi:hypothetical protein